MTDRVRLTDVPLTPATHTRLADVLAAIAATDPSRHGHTGPDTPETTARYNRRNRLVWAALTLARDAGIPAGVGVDVGDPRPVVVYIDLPTGQVSWHLPAYDGEWDGHSTNTKYRRLASYVRIYGRLDSGQPPLAAETAHQALDAMYVVRDQLAAELEQARADLAQARREAESLKDDLAAGDAVITAARAVADSTRLSRSALMTLADALAHYGTPPPYTAPAPGSATRAEEPAAESAATQRPKPGQFCTQHWSWLCQAGQGRCPAALHATDRATGGDR